jgi:hypothetical protein
MSTRFILAVADADDLATQVARQGAEFAGFAFKRDTNTLEVLDPDTGTFFSVPLAGAAANPVAGVAGGYKLARGTHTTVAASDTVVTGLATVVAAVVSFKGAPTINTNGLAADIGDQAGKPAAGSILIKSYKPTATNDVTPLPATTFGATCDWVAIGT